MGCGRRRGHLAEGLSLRIVLDREIVTIGYEYFLGCRRWRKFLQFVDVLVPSSFSVPKSTERHSRILIQILLSHF